MKKNEISLVYPDCQLNPEIEKLFENDPYRPVIYQFYQKDLGLLVNIACYDGLKDNINTEDI